MSTGQLGPSDAAAEPAWADKKDPSSIGPSKSALKAIFDSLLWKIDHFRDFLEARKVLLAAELNKANGRAAA